MPHQYGPSVVWVKRKVSQLKGGALNRLSVEASIERGAGRRGLLATSPAADTTTSQPVTGQWVSQWVAVVPALESTATCGVSETLASFTTGSMGICLDTGTDNNAVVSSNRHRVMTMAFSFTSNCEITIQNACVQKLMLKYYKIYQVINLYSSKPSHWLHEL